MFSKIFAARKTTLIIDRAPNDKRTALKDRSISLISDIYNAMQQYLRRDCIEITGIPILPLDNPKQLVQELGSLIDVSVSEDQISTAHRLPDTKKVKNRIIVKFVQRDKREEFYKKKKNLVGKKSSLLPSVQAEMGKKCLK